MPKVQDLIDRFTASRIWTPDTVVFRCDTISRILTRRCRAVGIDAAPLLLNLPLDMFQRAHPKWLRMLDASGGERIHVHHWTVRIGDLSYDFTMRQFDDMAAVPHVVPIADLSAWISDSPQEPAS